MNFFLGKERLLQPADFAPFARPSLLITAAPTSEQPPKARCAGDSAAARRETAPPACGRLSLLLVVVHPESLTRCVHMPPGISPPQPQRTREAELCDIVVRTLRAGGSVLLPCSPGGRALELILLLSSHWREKRNLDVCATYPALPCRNQNYPVTSAAAHTHARHRPS